MNMNAKLLLCLALVLSGCLLGCSTTVRHSTESGQWGPATAGLQMSLAVSLTNPVDPEFEVTIRNVGEEDVCLTLGYMLANGKVQLPNQIHLRLVDASGRMRELDFA